MKSKLKVLDLFSGAGGLSEGFRQMGFEIVAAVDNWTPAIVAHQANHPETNNIKADISKLDPSEFKDIDVIIGGPPCTEFSYSKKGGGGDIEKGMKLVLRFLYFVYKIKPRWWVMENVPRLLNTLPYEVPLNKIGVKRSGVLKIPMRYVLNAADYGNPQKRLRLISGNYPLPEQTHGENGFTTLNGKRISSWIFMRKIIEGLPNPCDEIKKGEVIKDPNYDNISIPIEELTDHFNCNLMSDEDAMKNKKSKTAHAWYGKMKFPDDLDRPSRTVMATQFDASRETMVIEVKIGNKIKYRKPTVRECACLQAFPITYQFPANNIMTKYKLVGNAVPVKLASAIAKAMLKAERLPIHTSPIIKK
jgi:DNA (cytosine-5)-methyltransferase 1